MRHSFTTSGAAQFRCDLKAILALLERYLLSSTGSSAFAGLGEALCLLNLPIEGNAGLSLGQVSDRLFTDNAEAKRVLEELGLVTLTPANARNIIQRRVENSE